jgi:hypothetical protein
MFLHVFHVFLHFPILFPWFPWFSFDFFAMVSRRPPEERRIDQLSAEAEGHAWALRVLTQRLEAAERRERKKAENKMMSIRCIFVYIYIS